MKNFESLYEIEIYCNKNPLSLATARTLLTSLEWLQDRIFPLPRRQPLTLPIPVKTDSISDLDSAGVSGPAKIETSSVS